MNDDEMEAQMEYWKSKAKAAEAERDRLREAITEYLSSETAGGDPIGPQWYIDCNERTKGKNYPGKARLARAALANEETT